MNNRAMLLVVVGLFGFFNSLQAAAISHLGTNQRVLVICVLWNDVATTRLATCNDWRNVLQTQVNGFYNNATFGQSTFTFETPVGGPANGWFALGAASTTYNFFPTGQSAITAADPNVDFTLYHRVLVITNSTGFSGQGGGPWAWTTAEGTEFTVMEGGVPVGKRLMTLAIANEWLASSFGNTFDEGGSAMAHELGHQLGVPTHYADVRWFPGIARDVITPWDIMGLSPSLNHFLGWPKAERQWTGASRITTVGPPVGSDIDNTYVLEPLESTGTGTQLLRIPLTSTSPFFGYFVESRRRISGDENLPSEGVLLSIIDQSPNTILKTIVLDDPGSPGDLNQAPLEVGDTFTDTPANLTVTYQNLSGNNANVRVQYRLPATARPNPRITPWGAPPWETPDIWIDSERNGWGAYRYKDSAGNPSGNGDDAWVNHVNRLYVRVSNGGPGVATNVRAEVYQNSPPGMGDAGASWAYLGTIVFPSIASGASASDFVGWTPTVGAHTCVKAVILNTTGELSTTDNLAQENVTAFDTTASRYKPVGLSIEVNNPFADAETPVKFHVRDIPPGWGILVEPPEMVLPPGGKRFVRFEVFPSGFGKATEPDDRYRPGFIGKPKIEAQVPYADTFIPIGGVEVWTHLVEHTQLTCESERMQRRATEKRETTAAEAGLMPRPGQTSPKATITDPKRLFLEGGLVRPFPRPEEVPAGGNIRVRGQLIPAVGGAIVAVELTSGNRRLLQFAKVDASGVYQVTFRPDAAGVWQARAYFDGDMRYEKSESNFCIFRVARGPAPR